MPETNECLACWPLQEMNSGSYRSEYSRRRGGQRSRSTPGELELAGRRKPLLCSCRNEVGMHFPVAAPNVPRSPEGTSKRRWCSSESRTLIWYRLTRIPAEYIPRRVKQQPASTATASRASTATVSHLCKPKLSRRCRECVHEVDNVSEDKSSVRQRIRTET
jgi:hypothetical protein